MKYKQDSHLNVNAPVGIAERTAPPIMSLLLCLLYIFAFYNYQTAGGQNWITHNCFQFSRFYHFITEQNLNQTAGQMVSDLYITNFSNLNMWFLLASVYITALFGIPVEKRLGTGRFILLIIFACTLPWVLQCLDIYKFPVWPAFLERSKEDVCFIGPYAIMLALAGAYSVLQPKKERDMTQSRWHRKDKMQIFNRNEEKAMNEKFGLSPNFFFGAFLVYMIVAHFVTIYFFKECDTIGLYAGLLALIGGFIQATVIQAGLQDNYQDHPLKYAAVKYYYELLDLDVGHKSAVAGAAKKFALPEDQVADWIKKSKGKLRPV